MALRRIPPGSARDELLPLLYLADEAHDHVRRHRDDGDLLVLDLPDGGRAAVQAVPRGAGDVELTLVAVDEASQGRGHGRQLLAETVAALRADGHRRVLVGTATAGVDAIAFYQKVGFRPLAIERDYFDASRGYTGNETVDGLPVRDLIWFDLEL